MRDLFSFCISVLSGIVQCYFGLELGDYSYGLFIGATAVIGIFISTLVISFRAAGGSPGSAVRPPRARRSATKS